MIDTDNTQLENRQGVGHFRNWFANHPGVKRAHKQALYIDISKSATRRIMAYWMQIFFAARIAIKLGVLAARSRTLFPNNQSCK